MNNKPFVYVIAGQTASGKTDIGISLAQKAGGEVVSADSVAVYTGLDIGSAKPTPAQTANVPHHMIDVVSPHKQFSVHDYSVLAHRAICGILQRGNVPVIVGGTGFYINAILYGTEFFGDHKELQRALEIEAQQDGGAALHTKLQQLDPAAALGIHPNNIRRIARAVAFVQTTDKLFSEHNREQKERESTYCFRFYVTYLPQSVLWRKIEARTHAMFKNGLVDEVRALLQSGLPHDCAALASIGYKQALLHIMGKLSLDEAIDAAFVATRQYAKRQATWFNNSAPQHEKICTQKRSADDVAAEILREASHVL